MVDEKRRTQFKVMVLPNLYGDILTDEAAEFQGGVGTAGSANIGKRYAMFEAIHGSAPRMVDEGRAQYADPSSIIRAAAMLLEHIGYQDKAKSLQMALDICGQYEKKIVLTGRNNGATGAEYAEYIMNTLSDPQLQQNGTALQNRPYRVRIQNKHQKQADMPVEEEGYEELSSDDPADQLVTIMERIYQYGMTTTSEGIYPFLMTMAIFGLHQEVLTRVH